MKTIKLPLWLIKFVKYVKEKCQAPKKLDTDYLNKKGELGV